MTLDANGLKPCPFCGAPVPVIYGVQVICESCGAGTMVQDTPEEAIAAWNRRVATARPALTVGTREAQADAIVTSLYRRFKEWSKKGFGPDDVTWCEVKADVISLIAAHPQAGEPIDPASAYQRAEESLCDCGAAGSGEGHTEWCAWQSSEWRKWGDALAAASTEASRIEAAVEKANRISGNYTANYEQSPTKIIFTNGRVVDVTQEGCLEVSWTNPPSADSLSPAPSTHVAGMLVTDAVVELVARAIDPVWWAWAAVHYDASIPPDLEQREGSLARAKRAIAALASPHQAPDGAIDPWEQLRRIRDVLSYPVAKAILSRGFDIRHDIDSVTFAAEIAIESLPASPAIGGDK